MSSCRLSMSNVTLGLFDAESLSLSNVTLGPFEAESLSMKNVTSDLFDAESLSLKDGLHDGQTEIPWSLVNVNMVLNVHRNRKAY